MSQMAVRSRQAPAKVNLCLHVTGRRPDGYHLLDSIVAFADLGDTVCLEPAPDAHSLQVSSTNLPPDSLEVPGHTDNIVWRALALHRRLCPSPDGVTIRLEKRIPSGAGLGGGSADAAAMLRLLQDASGTTGLTAAALLSQALRLGADVPICLQDSCMRMQGIGERLTPIAFAGALPAVLVWPGIALPTVPVFKARSGSFDDPIPASSLARLTIDPIGALAELTNGLTSAAIGLAPAIADALTALETRSDCQLARMSGSGSAIFGLFESADAAAAAAAALRGGHPDWWVQPVRLGPPLV